jgi:hypothetical protein
MAADFLAISTPGVALLIGQVVPAKRGGAEVGLGPALCGGGGLAGADVLPLALAKPASKCDHFTALPAFRDVDCFHRVMLFHSAAERAASLATKAYAADGAFIISLPIEQANILYWTAQA